MVSNMEQQEKLGFVEGIKALATMMVFNIHFLNAYYCGIYTLNPEHFHTAAGVEWYIGATPLNIVYAGKLGARIFLSVSAFLLARQYFIQKSVDYRGTNTILARAGFKKYFRLVIPILVVNIGVYIAMTAGCFHNDKAAALANSVEFFGSYNQFAPNLLEAVKEAVWDCFVTGVNRYNGPIWFIQYEFFGCLLVAAILAVAGKEKARYPVYIIASVILIRTDFLCMILSMVVADLMYTKRTLIENFTRQKWLMRILFIVGFFFATYPSYGDNLVGSVYALFPPKVLFYYNVAIPTMLFAIAHLGGIQKLLSARIFEKFNRISYCFYLVHFPLLCTVSASFFCSMYGKMNYHMLVLLNYLLTLWGAGCVAYVLTKLVDRPAQKIASHLTNKWIAH
ncbi:MAG: acyltransferase [Lachnospiraceae bacterium]|nr:acyltransferase [Lachnospiraceae bacterium]